MAVMEGYARFNKGDVVSIVAASTDDNRTKQP